MYCNDEVDVDIANDDRHSRAFYVWGVIDHIPAQNQTGNYLAAVVSVAAAKSAAPRRRRWDRHLPRERDRSERRSPASRVRFITSVWASRGANEIEALANQIAAGIDGDVELLRRSLVATAAATDHSGWRSHIVWK